MAHFSVIIPLFNKEDFIEKTLKSVLSQSFTDFEVIIINDGSTDKSEEKVLKFKDKRIQYFFKKNEGVAATRNFGIEKAQSNYITFIDADDFWYPNFLEVMFENIQRFPDLKVFSGAIEFEISKKVIPSSYSIIKTAESEIVNYFEASLKETVICTSCAVFDKRIFEKIGTFDIQLKNGEDTDLWIRLGLLYPVLFSWKILARYTYADKSLTKNHKTSIHSLIFSKYTSLEKTNPNLKKFLDLNRFSLAIKSKIMYDNERFKFFSKGIDLNNLSYKKRILLHLPAYLLKPLIGLKAYLTNYGFGTSVFK